MRINSLQILHLSILPLLIVLNILLHFDLVVLHFYILQKVCHGPLVDRIYID